MDQEDKLWDFPVLFRLRGRSKMKNWQLVEFVKFLILVKFIKI